MTGCSMLRTNNSLMQRRGTISTGYRPLLAFLDEITGPQPSRQQPPDMAGQTTAGCFDRGLQQAAATQPGTSIRMLCTSVSPA